MERTGFEDFEEKASQDPAEGRAHGEPGNLFVKLAVEFKEAEVGAKGAEF